MSGANREPLWLVAQLVQAIHDDLLAQHGGMPGLRDVGLFESALARPIHRWHFGKSGDIFDLAAAYGFGLAKNHPFNDGNKRTAFQSVYTFLGVNRYLLEANEVDVVAVMVAVAEGSLSERKLAAWLRNQSRPPRRARPGRASGA